MLLYRAINEFKDEENIKNVDGIKASRHETTRKCLEYAASHIALGSSPNSNDCWISTTKDFKRCASEFSIPQMGGYNTAMQRKKIAVIDRKKMLKANPNYVPNSKGNYTYISGGKTELDLCDSGLWPPSSDAGKGKMKEIEYSTDKKLKVNKKLMDRHVNFFNRFINSLVSIDIFIFDMTFPTRNDRGGSDYVPLNEFSFMDYLDRGIITPSKSPNITSGLIKRNREVLILNEVPFNSIIKVLSLLEIDILYALDNSAFRTVLDDIIKGTTVITMQGQHVLINGKPLIMNTDERWLVDELYNKNTSMIDLTYNQYMNNGAFNLDIILDLYNNLKNLKRGVIKKILDEMEQQFSGSIVEDGIYVAIKDNNQLDDNMSQRELCKYDLLLIGDNTNGKVYKFTDRDYSKIWRENIESDFIIKDNVGICHNCQFSKNNW